MSMLHQLFSILPGAKAPARPYSGPCAAESFVASRLKRQGTTAPFPRQNDPQAGVDTHFGAQCLREAANMLDHPPPAAPDKPQPPILHSLLQS